jgi:Fe-S-cluster-containing hydrogenase component 2
LKAHYGYKDGAGDFFIIIDTDHCVDCQHHGCVAACPEGIIEIILDDYDDEIAAVVEGHRKKIKHSCAPCKPELQRSPPPCVTACTPGAIAHSW